MTSTKTSTATVPTRQTAFDYDRTVIAFHGTRRATAELLVAGTPFGASTNDDDWLGHVFVPLQAKRGLPRLWVRSGIFEGAHIQLCVREPKNIMAVWSVKRDGRYGKDSKA